MNILNVRLQSKKCNNDLFHCPPLFKIAKNTDAQKVYERRQQHLSHTSEWQCATVRADPLQLLCGTCMLVWSKTEPVSVWEGGCIFCILECLYICVCECVCTQTASRQSESSSQLTIILSLRNSAD